MSFRFVRRILQGIRQLRVAAIGSNRCRCISFLLSHQKMPAGGLEIQKILLTLSLDDREDSCSYFFIFLKVRRYCYFRRKSDLYGAVLCRTYVYSKSSFISVTLWILGSKVSFWIYEPFFMGEKA